MSSLLLLRRFTDRDESSPGAEATDGREHADGAKSDETQDGDLRPWRIICQMGGGGLCK